MLTSIYEEVEKIMPDVTRLATQIGKYPELGYQEVYAAEQVSTLLEQHGHEVHRQYRGVQTAVRSDTHRSGENVTAFLAEYDALPDIGHACGHNLIAAVAVGTFIVMSRLFPDEPFSLLGCPAEESVVQDAGGKVQLLEQGAFENVGMALMVHPYAHDAIITEGSLFAQTLTIELLGKPSHASIAPHLGNNALDAAVQLYLGLEFLKSKLYPGQQLQAVISEGGKTPNVIVDIAELKVRFRGDTPEKFATLKALINDVVAGIGEQTSVATNITEFTPVYKGMQQNAELYDEAIQSFEDLGIIDFAHKLRFGSTDFGNVSRVVPALEIGIGLGDGLTPHTKEFQQAANSTEMTDTIRRGITLLSLTSAKALQTRQHTE